MGNQIRPKSKGAHKGSYYLENFVSKLERELLAVGWNIEILRGFKNNWNTSVKIVYWRKLIKYLFQLMKLIVLEVWMQDNT